MIDGVSWLAVLHGTPACAPVKLSFKNSCPLIGNGETVFGGLLVHHLPRSQASWMKHLSPPIFVSRTFDFSVTSSWTRVRFQFWQVTTMFPPRAWVNECLLKSSLNRRHDPSPPPHQWQHLFWEDSFKTLKLKRRWFPLCLLGSESDFHSTGGHNQEAYRTAFGGQLWVWVLGAGCWLPTSFSKLFPHCCVFPS